MIVMLLTLLISTSQLPVEYKGWINNCTLYFQPTTSKTSSVQEQFKECHSHICQDYYLMSCDKYVLDKKYSLAECMKVCCNQQSAYHQFPSVLDFLSQCQEDYIRRKNKIVTTTNRLPLKVLLYTLLGLVVLMGVCIVFAYSEEIMEWGRERLANRNRNQAGIQLRNFLN